ncbi:hypothetical protein [Actinoplanes sp. NPDC051859]|uniref:hypothetical protein n=1 Tax=Actinoplanes sp. NPDC051859 TaxID=3363909 RepID=UPI0037A68EF6
MTAVSAVGPESGETRTTFVTYQQKLAADLSSKAAEKADTADQRAVAESRQAAHQTQQAYQAQQLAQVQQQQALTGGAVTASVGSSLDITI